MTKIYYTTEPEFDDYLHIKSGPYDDIIEWVLSAAKDFYSNHDGYENSWPLDIWLWNEDGTPIDCYSVDVEFSPTFYALKKEKAND